MDNGYVTFLVLGIVLVAIDGHLIYRAGKGYLHTAYGSPESAQAMNRMVTVLFHLVVLGLVFLISLIDVETGDRTKDVIARLGILLLLIAAAHAVTMTILGRIRDRAIQQQLADEMAEEHRQFEVRHREDGIPHQPTQSPQVVEQTAVEQTTREPRSR
ncbi:hypothetical protein [Umezawaea beigongshangensis]|uniref:hypothetical protein n=1 Tax=Umezawaea beigongshangensis TaxID=2780383 RepID=UPI0018F214DB|nr:hypothetical protein [Umezawaea beigongshangensis]